jgi:hypothetical protein
LEYVRQKQVDIQKCSICIDPGSKKRPRDMEGDEYKEYRANILKKHKGITDAEEEVLTDYKFDPRKKYFVSVRGSQQYLVHGWQDCGLTKNKEAITYAKLNEMSDDEFFPCKCCVFTEKRIEFLMKEREEGKARYEELKQDEEKLQKKKEQGRKNDQRPERKEQKKVDRSQYPEIYREYFRKYEASEKGKANRSKEERKVMSFRRLAIRKGNTVNLSDAQIAFIQKMDCYYCGLEICGGHDRLDSTIHLYSEELIVPCDPFCNKIKSSQTKDEFLLAVELIHQYSHLKDHIPEEKYRELARQSTRKFEGSNYKVFKQHTIKRGMEFPLTEEEWNAKVRTECYLCGMSANLTSLSLDRVDNTLLTYKNALPCCPRCNFMKGDRPLSDFLDRIEKIASYVHQEITVVQSQYLTEANEEKYVNYNPKKLVIVGLPISETVYFSYNSEKHRYGWSFHSKQECADRFVQKGVIHKVTWKEALEKYCLLPCTYCHLQVSKEQFDLLPQPFKESRAPNNIS